MIKVLNDFSKYTREFKYNLKLAFPVMIGMLGHTFVQFIDNIMVGQLGTAELAAISLGNSFVFIAMSIGIGFSSAITPLVAEADGAKKEDDVSRIFEHSFLICLILGIVLFLSVFLNRNLLYSMNQPIEVVELASPYLFWVSMSLITIVTFQSFRQFADGLSFTRAAMYSTLVGNAINVILNFFLIFGFWIFPKLGVEGAAIGTLISRICMLTFIIFYLKLHKKLSKYIKKFFPSKVEIKRVKKILYLGLPSALHSLFEVAFFVSAVWMSGFIGKNSQAANQIALNLSSMTYMVALGVGVAAMIRVGNQRGMMNFKKLREVALSTLLLIIIIDIFFCFIFLTFNDSLPLLYLDSSDPSGFNDVSEVLKIASNLLIVAGVFQLFDGIQAVVLGSLRGMQDVIKPAIIIFFSYGILGFPISYTLGFYTSLGMVGIWIGLLSGLFFSSLFLFLRFNYLSKKIITLND
ncbi:MAG: MATE family efflux transporter [Candidatus Marisimplicoccus sp.]|jgi:MATE family multidrug resistance protein|nr:MATE family efflux transporter [Cryomorphaceae bacterium]MBT7739384.1 MATE family efflux transporter [Cryomorphaceae bacterium]MDC3218981.1 MATE family efflux transporter [Flavobacteriaceae bacterium]RZP00865.1 MAG: MATE family efflux transporter [Flavobacteriales bacterium]|tara:strand:+ start:1990 stop:3381 length:1392 start_codon:yes stop_codon:yes gene_type:complete